MDVRQSPFPLRAGITAVLKPHSSCMCPRQLVQFWFEDGDWGIYQRRNDTDGQRCTFSSPVRQLAVQSSVRASVPAPLVIPSIYTNWHSVQGPGGQEPEGRLVQVQSHSDEGGWRDVVRKIHSPRFTRLPVFSFLRTDTEIHVFVMILFILLDCDFFFMLSIYASVVILHLFVVFVLLRCYFASFMICLCLCGCLFFVVVLFLLVVNVFLSSSLKSLCWFLEAPWGRLKCCCGYFVSFCGYFVFLCNCLVSICGCFKSLLFSLLFIVVLCLFAVVLSFFVMVCVSL